MGDHAFRQFVLKVHSRCNLACDHCYVYEAVDQSWREQPRAMSTGTLEATARAITQHVIDRGLERVSVVLHGGEPLLLGRQRLGEILSTLRSRIEPHATLELTMQTNGILLTRTMADLLLEHRVQVGISLDGGREANDRHRRYAHGGSSYDAVVRAVKLLGSAPYRPIFAGLLCTVDVANDPVRVFEDLADLEPPMIDVLLPHATWEHPPPQAEPGRTPYGDWLVAMFDRWFDSPRGVGVRMFIELGRAAVGGVSRSEAIGDSGPESLVVETDGSLEETDALKVAFPGAAHTGMNVFDHTLSDVLAVPEAMGSLTRAGDLSPACRACPVVAVCGGGLYPHRYRPDSGFANPSVYCADLRHLVGHVIGRLHDGGLTTVVHPDRLVSDLERSLLTRI